MLPRLAEIVKEEAPDYLLYDAMCPWGWQTAQYLNMPSVSSMSLLALTPGLLIRSGFLFRMMGVVLKNLRYVRQFRQVSQEMKRMYGVPALGLVDFLNVQGTITINYTSRLFQPGAKSMPESVKFVGPSIKARDDAGNFPFDDFNDDPLVYISLGTVINQNSAFFERCVSAFRDADYRVVMSVGEKISIKSFEIPSNFTVRNHVPQLEVLKRAAVFITHAGMNSVQEGLYFGVPLVLVPQQTEQSFVALRAEQLGVGVRLEGEITADRLRRAVKQILEHPRYSEQAKKIGTSLREAGGYQRAVDEIFAFKQAHGL
jgi:MGT family glycosyltransferase